MNEDIPIALQVVTQVDSENDELGAILFILVKLISRNVSWLTELNRDALEFKWVH